MREPNECDNYRDDEDGIYCVARAERCRFIHRNKCKDFVSVIDAQIAADKQQGTNFAEALYGEKPDWEKLGLLKNVAGE